MTIADVLTISRLPLIVMILAAAVAGRFDWAAAGIAVFALTDLLDGRIARRLPKTKHGGWLDASFDKLLLLFWWATVLLVQVDPLIVNVIGAYTALQLVLLAFALWHAFGSIPEVAAANSWGKLKTFSEMIAGLSMALGIHLLRSELVLAATFLLECAILCAFFSLRGKIRAFRQVRRLLARSNTIRAQRGQTASDEWVA